MTLRLRAGLLPTTLMLIGLAACNGDGGTDPDPVQQTLTITGSGVGSGTVTSAPAGINCTFAAGVVSGSCSTTFDEGTAVVLTAAPAAGSSFAAWMGACTGAGTCSVTMSADQTADAQFEVIPQHTLTVTGSSTGTGTVTSAPAGIACTSTAGVESGTCSTAYDEGTAVVLTAAAVTGSSFVGWTGACTGTGTCSVTMSADMSADAQFEVSPQRTLTITGSSTGTGTVISTPAGISCTSTGGVESGTCSVAFNDGQSVTLTATPAGGHTFELWTGACTGTGGACILSMTADRTADAQFDRTPPPPDLIETWEALSLTFTPTGGGASVDPIASGTELTIAFRSDFTYTLTEIDPGPPPSTEVEDGAYTITSGVLTLIPDAFPADAEAFTIDVLTATSLQVSSSNSFFDFNGDGTETPASLVAVFQIQGTAPVQRSLTVTGSSTGTGTITSAPAGINCTTTAGVESGTCSTTFDDGTAVVLTAAAATNSSFVTWTGAGCAGGGTCSLTMDADKTTNAQIDFVPPPTNLVGTWDATSITFTPTGGGASVDIIAQGITLFVVLRSDFTYTLTEVDPGPPQVTNVESGTFTVTGGGAGGVGALLTLTPTGLPPDLSLTIQALTATDMTLFNANDVFDFNDDGTETPASLTAVFVKR